MLFNRVCAGELRIVSYLQGLDFGLVLVLDANCCLSSSLKRRQQVIQPHKPVNGAGAGVGSGLVGCGTYGSIA